jgi:hypothetical protein
LVAADDLLKEPARLALIDVVVPPNVSGQEQALSNAVHDVPDYGVVGESRRWLRNDLAGKEPDVIDLGPTREANAMSPVRETLEEISVRCRDLLDAISQPFELSLLAAGKLPAALISHS